MTRLQKALRKLRLITIAHDTEPVELLLGATALLWGFWLLLPFDSFTSPVTHLMGQVAREDIWGAVFASIGLSQIAALFFASAKVRQSMAMVAMLCWLFTSITLAVTDFRLTGVPVYFSLAAHAAWVYVRHSIGKVNHD